MKQFTLKKKHFDGLVTIYDQHISSGHWMVHKDIPKNGGEFPASEGSGVTAWQGLSIRYLKKGSCPTLDAAMALDCDNLPEWAVFCKTDLLIDQGNWVSRAFYGPAGVLFIQEKFVEMFDLRVLYRDPESDQTRADLPCRFNLYDLPGLVMPVTAPELNENLLQVLIDGGAL